VTANLLQRLPTSSRRKTLPRCSSFQHDLLDAYTPDGYCAALSEVIGSAKPDLVLFPHTYQVRDFAPKTCRYVGQGHDWRLRWLSQRGLASWCFVRQMFQGQDCSGRKPFKARRRGSPLFKPARFAPTWPPRTLPAKPRSTPSPLTWKPEQIRTTPLRLFQGSKICGGFDSGASYRRHRRGIKAPENIPQAQALAKALGAEIAASRPICDEGWLPMERQIGSSGQTVAPKLYIAWASAAPSSTSWGHERRAHHRRDQQRPKRAYLENRRLRRGRRHFEIMPALTEALEKASRISDRRSLSLIADTTQSVSVSGLAIRFYKETSILVLLRDVFINTLSLESSGASHIR